MATNPQLKPLTPIIFEQITVMAVHGNSCAVVPGSMTDWPRRRPLPHANAHILKAARHQRGALTCLQRSLARIQTFLCPFLPPALPSAPR